MARKNECVAMLLAGGQGSRLGILTQKVAKPAVSYGGKYRIIDFPLSNCSNSGINTVGVLTQYQPLVLNEYLGNGQAWDLDRVNGGVHVLSPYQQIKGTTWYKGTANSIYQNINFIDRYNPKYVVVLSGDHIYKMNYNKMLEYHKIKGAAATIAEIEVPWDEASRFGLMITDKNNRILEFEEKPSQPRTNKASMGIYIFTWEKLRKYLIEDENNPNSSNDFGHDVIPAMHRAGEDLFAYLFDGYWKDVGTLGSLWEANLDILNENSGLDLSDNSWKIYSGTEAGPPQYVSDSATLSNSMAAEGCKIYGNVEYSVLFNNVIVEDGAEVIGSVIMPGTVIKKGAKVHYSIVAENAVISENATVGIKPEEYKGDEPWGVALVGEDVCVGKNARVLPNEQLAEDKEA